MDETYQILLGLRERYEAHHKLRYTDEALDAAAKYSHQYISDRWPFLHLIHIGLQSMHMPRAPHLSYLLAPAAACISVRSGSTHD